MKIDWARMAWLLSKPTYAAGNLGGDRWGLLSFQVTLHNARIEYWRPIIRTLHEGSEFKPGEWLSLGFFFFFTMVTHMVGPS